MSVASKNLFELLGNDADSEGEVKPPKKEIVKQTTSTKKKDAEVVEPAQHAQGRPGRGRGRPNYSGTEAAFRDRQGGREQNRARGTDEGGAPRGVGRGRPRQGGRRDMDRHSQTGRVDTEKQVSQGWGSNENEWTEEKAGESIAQAEASTENAPVAAEPEVVGETEAVAPVPEEPEDKMKTYDDYLAEKLAKQAALGPVPQARQPNEGSRTDAKWKNAKPLTKDEDEDVLFAGKEAKAKREKERKQKQIIEIDQRFQENPRGGRGRGRGERGDRRGGPRGGGGGFRGERGDGGFRGDRAEGGFRGDRGDRGDGGFRGDRGDGGYRGDGGHRGERRGGHGGRNNGTGPVNIEDPNAFPSLGAR